MPSSEHFLNLVETGVAKEVKKYLEEVVSVLLAHPDVNVNQSKYDESTPFLLGCFNGEVGVVKVLLKDSRVDINMSEEKGRTPLWWASCNGYLDMIKWMIALRGDELNLDKIGKFWNDDKDYTAIEAARYFDCTKVVSLLERFMVNPVQTRHDLRVELGLVDKDAADLFAMTVFLCDDFLRLKEANSAATSAARFFNIASYLPMELQMVLCYRVFGSSKENIKSKDSEAAFKSLARTFHLE
jgi:hypothetical protein